MITLQGKKIILLLFIALIVASRVDAQRVFMIFGHAVYGIPVDKNFNHGYQYGIGIEGGGGIGWDKTFLMGTLGYSSFFDEAENSLGNVSIVPFKAGIRQYVFLHMIYLHADLGWVNIRYQEKDDSHSRFSGNIGAGVKLGAFEVQMDYDGFSRSNPSGYASWIGLKAGFAFGL